MPPILPIRSAAQEVAFQYSAEAIFITDRAGRIMDFNPAAAHLMENCERPPATFPAWAVLDTAQSNTPVEINLTNDADGSICWFQARLLDLPDNPDQKMIMLQDITEQKRAEALVLAAQEVTDSVGRIKHDFVANMSHELRTPLNSILGFASLLVQGTYGVLSETQQARVETIIHSSKQLLDVINNILEIGQLEGGQATATPEPVTLAPLLSECLSTITPDADRQGLALQEHIDPDLPTVYVDPRRLRQAVLHLLDNALKFTPEGNVTLRASWAQDLSGSCLPTYLPHQAGGWVVIAIADTGIGIEEQYWQTIFAPFHQHDSSNTRHYDGCGLGLAIAKLHIQNMAGFIHLESQPGQGSTFSILLPVDPMPQVAQLDD